MLELPATDELYGPPSPVWDVLLDRVRETFKVESEDSASELGWLVAIHALLAPPAVCFAAWVVWRRLYPDAAKLAAGRRSRAAATALRTLDRTGGNAERIAAALIGYLRDRAGVPPTATTPAEVTAALAAQDCPASQMNPMIALLQRCDAVRFAAEPPGDTTLPTDAAKTVLEWEAAAWPESAS